MPSRPMLSAAALYLLYSCAFAEIASAAATDPAALVARYSSAQPRLWGERLPGITTTLPPNSSGAQQIALTLDACGGKRGQSCDTAIITLLQREKLPATIFVTSAWLRNNPESARAIADDPLFEVAAHGERHKPASVNGRSAHGLAGTASVAELIQEVEGNVRDIRQLTGRRPVWYRSGAAFYDETAVAVILGLGLRIAGYSLAADEGASLGANAVAQRLGQAKNNDIILCHINRPRSGTAKGLETMLPRLKAAGFQFIRLSE